MHYALRKLQSAAEQELEPELRMRHPRWHERQGVGLPRVGDGYRAAVRVSPRWIGPG